MTVFCKKKCVRPLWRTTKEKMMDLRKKEKWFTCSSLACNWSCLTSAIDWHSALISVYIWQWIDFLWAGKKIKRIARKLKKYSAIMWVNPHVKFDKKSWKNNFFLAFFSQHFAKTINFNLNIICAAPRQPAVLDIVRKLIMWKLKNWISPIFLLIARQLYAMIIKLIETLNWRALARFSHHLPFFHVKTVYIRSLIE